MTTSGAQLGAPFFLAAYAGIVDPGWTVSSACSVGAELKKVLPANGLMVKPGIRINL